MLILPIKRKWFDMILSGEKKEEYRDIKPYYDTRLMDEFGMIWVGDELIRAPMPELQKNRVQLVAFRNGYGKDVPTIWAECSLSAGYGRRHNNVFINERIKQFDEKGIQDRPGGSQDARCTRK